MSKDDALFFLFLCFILIIVTGFGVVALLLEHRKRKEMVALYHQQCMAAIEKGLEVPPPLEYRKPRLLDRYLLNGLIWLFIGLTLFVALYVNEGITSALYALVPAGVGFAHLICYFAVGKKLAENLGAGKAKPAVRHEAGLGRVSSE